MVWLAHVVELTIEPHKIGVDLVAAAAAVVAPIAVVLVFAGFISSTTLLAGDSSGCGLTVFTEGSGYTGRCATGFLIEACSKRANAFRSLSFAPKTTMSDSQDWF